MVVAGLDDLAAAGWGAAAAGLGAPPGRLPTGRAGEAGRLGLTVMRAVSLGGADLTIVVPDLPPAETGVAGVEAVGFNGTLTGAGGVTTVVAAAGPGGGVTTVVAAAVVGGADGTTGLTGLKGVTAPGVTGLTGLTGRTAPAAGLAGRTGAGGMPGFAGAPPMGAGMTGGGGPALGAMAPGKTGACSMTCVLRGGATGGSCIEGGGGGVVGVFIGGGWIEVVAGETRGGGMTMLDFFLRVIASSASPATTAAATATAGTTEAGREGTGGASSTFAGSGAGLATVLLAGD